jgi:hypothetical protein
VTKRVWEQWDPVLGKGGQSGADKRPPDDDLDFSESVGQASVYCSCIRVDALGPGVKKLEDKTVAESVTPERARSRTGSAAVGA